MSEVPFLQDNNTLPTKEVFYIFPEAIQGLVGNYAAELVATAGDTAALTGYFPHDFTTFVDMTIVFVPSGIATDMTLDVDFAATGEAFNTHTGTQPGGIPVVTVVNEITELPLVALFGVAVRANDYFGFTVTNIGTGGVAGANFHVLGVRLRYV